jgi:hypothetical protein
VRDWREVRFDFIKGKWYPEDVLRSMIRDLLQHIEAMEAGQFRCLTLEPAPNLAKVNRCVLSQGHLGPHVFDHTVVVAEPVRDGLLNRLSSVEIHVQQMALGQHYLRESVGAQAQRLDSLEVRGQKQREDLDRIEKRLAQMEERERIARNDIEWLTKSLAETNRG